MTINEEEIQKLIDERAEQKAKELLAKEHGGLIKNKDEILSEKKQLEAQLAELKNKLDTVDITKYNQLLEKEKKNELVSKGSSQELAELQLQLERMSVDLQSKEKEVQEKDGKYTSLKSQLDNITKTSELQKAFDSNNIDPTQKEILLSYFSGRTDFDSTGRVVIKKDDGTLTSPMDYISEWSKTDMAKPYIKAPLNSGGNANGSGGTLGVKLDTKTNAELHELAREKPHLLESIQREMRARNVQ